jgi:cytochrome P450
MIPAYSGIPAFDMNHMSRYFRRLYAEHGPFLSLGFPGLGTGIKGTLYVVRDPDEMLKIIRQEKHPSGIVELEWPLIDYMNAKGYSAVGLLGRGEEWKRLRGFIQKDLLAPASARGYLPGILLGAAKASGKAPAACARSGELYRYFNDSALDMFTEVLFGGDDLPPGEYRLFCDSAADGLALLFAIMRDPLESLYRAAGYRSAKVRRFAELFDVLEGIVRRRLDRFLEKVGRGALSEGERSSYFAKLLERQPDSPVSRDELLQIVIFMYVAAVDTTAAKASWNVVQLALHPDFQERLRHQLSRAVAAGGGDLTAAVLAGPDVPLLPALVRETHRCTPVAFADLVKKVSVETAVHGVPLPAGSTVVFDSLTNAMDPDLVDDPLAFRPERWLRGAVEARRGTPSEIIDHPFYSGPFSQGARRCPGSRVAHLEVQALVARLVLDYKIEGPPGAGHWDDYPGELKTLRVPAFGDGIRFSPRK